MFSSVIDYNKFIDVSSEVVSESVGFKAKLNCLSPYVRFDVPIDEDATIIAHGTATFSKPVKMGVTIRCHRSANFLGDVGDNVTIVCGLGGSGTLIFEGNIGANVTIVCPEAPVFRRSRIGENLRINSNLYVPPVRPTFFSNVKSFFTNLAGRIPTITPEQKAALKTATYATITIASEVAAYKATKESEKKEEPNKAGKRLKATTYSLVSALALYKTRQSLEELEGKDEYKNDAVFLDDFEDDEEAPVAAGNNLLHQRTIQITDYLRSFENRPKNSDVIAELKLTPAEEKELQDFIDPITQDYANIPVRILGHLNSYESIQSMRRNADGSRVEPVSRDVFFERDIHPSRPDQERILEKIKLIKDRRAAAAAAPVEGVPSPAVRVEDNRAEGEPVSLRSR